MYTYPFSNIVKKICTVVFLLIPLFLVGCSDPKTTALSEQYKYANNGRLIEKIARDGGKTRFKYNDKEFIEKITYPKGFERYSYDVNGNRAWIENEQGETKYKYDAFNRLTEVVSKYSPEKKIKYEYDPWNRVSGIEILADDQIEYRVIYEYDIFGNFVSIDNGNGEIKYQYFYDKGKMVRYLPNGIKTIFLYSPLGDLVSLEHFSSQNRLITSYSYKYDPPGRISFVTEKTSNDVKITRYKWDSRGYLKTLHLPNGNSINYKYDPMGNRILMSHSGGLYSYEYDNFGRITKAGETKYKWDKNGNLSSRIENQSKIRIRYDGKGLPTLIRTPNAIIRYGWDIAGNLISKRIGKDITQYLPNPLSPGVTIAEYDRTGKITKSYLYGDALLGARNTSGKMQYFLEDGFNSIRLISNHQGKIIGQRDYSPFAKPTFTEGNFPIDFRTAGERYLPEIKSYVIDGRLYDPHIGRHSAPDRLSGSLMRFDSLNKYAHGCRLNPEPRCNQTHKNSGVYRPIDFNRREYRRAIELIERGQRLPLPSQEAIMAHDQYWENGDYMNHDPYYKRVIAPLDSGSLAIEKGKHDDIAQFGRDSFRTWVPGYSQVEDLLRIGVGGFTKFYGGLIDNAFKQIDKDFSDAGINVTPTTPIKDSAKHLMPTRKDLIEDGISLWAPKPLKPVQKILDFKGKFDWFKDSLDLLPPKKDDNKIYKPPPSPTFMIDIPGVGWLGEARANHWGNFLGPDKTPIYIRHQGPGKDNWASPKESNAIIVTLPHKWDKDTADKLLHPHIDSAFSKGKNIHFVIDMNITLERHLTPVFSKLKENKWAANVTDYITEHSNDQYKGILVEHSRGTVTNRYINDFSAFDQIIVSSPRGDDALNWIKNTSPPTYVITGLSDAPNWRWKTRYGKLLKKPNVHIIQFQNIGNPVNTHSKLQNLATTGKWKIFNGGETKKINGSLGAILADKLWRATTAGKDMSINKDSCPECENNDFDDATGDIFDERYRSWRSPPGGPPGGGGGPYGCPGPGCGDGGTGGPFGGGSSGPGGGGSDFFKTVEKKLGGIRLDVEPLPAQGLRIGALKGVTYDPENKRIVLIGDQNLEVPSIRIADLAEAMRFVYDSRFYGPYPAFSLDPADPLNPEGEWLKARYEPDWIKGSEIGRLMYITDWLLKQYSFGVEFNDNNRLQERNSQIKEYRSRADLSLSDDGGRQWFERLRQKCSNIDFDLIQSKKEEPEWARMWIEVKNKEVRLHRKQKTVYIEEPEMIVTAKRQVPDSTSPTGLRDVESEDSPAKVFAEEFECLYDKFALESPEYGRLKEYTKALIIAKWLKKLGLPFNQEWIKENLYENAQYTDKVHTILWEPKKTINKEYPIPGGIRTETEVRSVRLFGGVDLHVEPKYVKTKNNNFYEKASQIDTIVQKELANGLSGRFTFSAGNKNFTGIVIPLEKQQKKVKPKIIEVKGARYEFGENGKVVKSISQEGTTAYYSYNPAGNLKAMDTQSSNGWKLNGKKDGNGSIWKVTKPDNNTFSYSYDKSGYLNKFEVNGQKWAEYKYNKKRNEVTAIYADYTEKINYDLNKNITEYEVKNLTNHKKEIIKFAYYKAGNLSDITIANKSLVNITYQRDSTSPSLITTPRAEINYSYDNNGSLQKVIHSSGISAAFQYENKQVKKLNLSYKNREAEYLYNSNGIIKSKNLSGLITDYRYKNGRISSVATNHYGKAEYIYDGHNRMKEIHFPDGSRIEYKYREKKSKKAKLSNTTYAVTTTYHPKAIASSSSITSKETNIKNEDISSVNKILKKRVEDDIAATKKIKNSVVLDLFIENDYPHINVVNSKGQIQQIDREMAKKFRKLINLTSKTRGKLGRTLIKRWDNFYNNHLASMGKPSYQKFHGSKKVKIKPILIIKSNEVNYKYSNIEKVPALTENFIVFIASKSAENMPETSAKILIGKINDIPRLSRKNIVFTINPPEMTNNLRKEWENTVAELQKIVGKENVLFNPTKQEFGNMLSKHKKDIVVIELTHTDEGIALKGNEIFSSNDILKGKDLSHIKYLLSGLGTCNLPQLEEGKFEASLRQKGVGIINGSYREVDGDIALKRLEMLMEILKNIDQYDLPAYYIHDIIDQLLEIIGRKTIHLGKLEIYKKVVYNIV